MHLAAAKGHDDVCTVLGSNGGDVSIRYQYGKITKLKDDSLVLGNAQV